MRLSERELDVMQTLWSAGGAASVADVQNALAADGKSLAYTTVQTMLGRLAEKGQVSRRLEAGSYLYSPTVKAPTVKRSLLQSIARRFFNGSVAELAVHLVEEEMSDEDVRRIERLLKRRRGRSR